jgi:hypothetical protein
MMRISSEGDGGCCCTLRGARRGVDGGTMATRRSAGAWGWQAHKLAASRDGQGKQTL